MSKEIKNLETGEREILDVYVYNTTNPNFSYDNLIPVTSGDWKIFKK